MKSRMKLLCICMVLIVLIVSSFSTAYAAKSASVNGKSAQVGDTVEYTFNISDCIQNITGIHIVIFYDTDVLSLIDAEADNLGTGTVINENENNNGQVVILNGYINGSKGLKCYEKTAIVTASFEVADSSDTEIAYYIPYLYDSDLVNINNYTFTYDLSVNGTKVVSDETPVLASLEQAYSLDDVGDFVNTVDGAKTYSDSDTDNYYGDDEPETYSPYEPVSIAPFEPDTYAPVEGVEDEDDIYSEYGTDDGFGFDAVAPEAESASASGPAGYILGVIVVLLLILGLPLLIVAVVAVIIVIVVVSKKKKRTQQLKQEQQEQQEQ